MSNFKSIKRCEKWMTLISVLKAVRRMPRKPKNGAAYASKLFRSGALSFVSRKLITNSSSIQHAGRTSDAH